MSPEPRRSPPTRIPSRVWWIAAVTGVGAFMAMLDSTVANLAVESIRVEFDASLADVQWVATGYLVALAVSLPAAGWLGVRHGYGRVWAAALAVFVVGSALCALAPAVPVLIAARLLQGLAAGIMVPAGQAVIGAVAGPDQLGRLMGALGVVVSLGPALGPAFGGLLLDVASWRWLFWINVPIGVVALVAARGLVPPGRGDPGRTLDRRGLVLLGAGLPLALYGITEIGVSRATAVPLAAVLLGLALTAGFVRSAAGARRPLIDLGLLRHRGFTAATVTTGLTGANMYGGLLLLPLYLQLDAGMDTTATGLMLLAMGLGSAVALYAGGRMTDRYGAGPVIAAGAAMLLLTSVAFLAVGSMPAGVPVVVLVLRGIGLALAQLPATAAAYAAVTADQLGDATTLVNIAQRVGGAIGAAGLVVLLSATTGDDGYGWGFAALAVVSALTLAAARDVAAHAGRRHRGRPRADEGRSGR
ncbi:DHA2 family efflux MFS transporter permease subunit [Jiangella muralis]|uniref:DHA2 family efflux MFS transporter permease subunit n=1 Tax=Jiangella muralis TaxID=702383 RepID=UPI00069FE7BD|nr:DHA2 family efflux MFS transporter permease subunit [Jiangella muralis]